MNRRESLKILGLGSLLPASLLDAAAQERAAVRFASDWQDWPDMRWSGPAYWGNRLQDWYVRDGAVTCMVSAENRSLHCLTHRLKPDPEAFELEVTVELLNADPPQPGARYVGFRVGSKGPFDDYRSAAVFGEGLDVGLTTEGRLFIGSEVGDVVAAAERAVRLRLDAQPAAVPSTGAHTAQSGYHLMLTALHPESGRALASLSVEELSGEYLSGNVALVSHYDGGDDSIERPSVRFSDWSLGGRKVLHDPEAEFGPICFAQYTLHRGTLKLTAQLAPIEQIRRHRVSLELFERGHWETVAASAVDPLARIAHFRVTAWDAREDVPYRIRVELPLKSGPRVFYYDGIVAREPVEGEALRTAVFSCNADHGFPDAEVVLHVNKHRPHAAFFLGDQFYEANGGFGIQIAPLEKSTLDCLHKWYLFGWSYRDIFRNIPAAFLPDDHDVYHGNIWGAGGRRAPVELGWRYPSQDGGGYKMPPEWVNMLHRMQTSHLPDPYDPIPVEQGITVYYTRWDYAGVSFALLGDRVFKSAPREILPEEAQVVNGFVTNPAFDIQAYRDLPDAMLLGDRQEQFLTEWCSDWSGGVEMKVVLSQSPFCAVHTLPEGSTSDSIVPQLPIPEPGEYVAGDAPAGDMDTNGWPMNRRDEALRTLRRCFAFHLAGDQHLATVVRYGIDDFDDGGFVFTGPALNNYFPRRWWPAPERKQFALAGEPAYTGGFFDAFGNRITVHAVANPRQTRREPAIVHDRASGYGIVVFDKAQRRIRIECWPRYADPAQGDGGQYAGWPITIDQEDNYGGRDVAWLPELQVEGLDRPVLEVIDEETNEVVYALRIPGRTYRPRVFRDGLYTVRLLDPETDAFDERRHLRPAARNDEVLHFQLSG